MPAENKAAIQDSAHEALKVFALTPNYNEWIFSAFREYLEGRTVLEVGCGIGNMSRYFSGVSSRFLALDTSETFIGHLKVDQPGLDARQLDIAGGRTGVLASEGIEAVVSVNVMEHVPDDAGAFLNIYRLLKPGGRLLLFVPALSSIYGTLDEAVSHCRRYDRGELRAKVEKAGFEVEKLYFSNFIGVLGWYLNGKVLKTRKFPMLQPLLFDKFVPLIAALERLFPPPFGMNLILVARKK
ncbi:MAG TPA: class I SAM-dependent methyltransferase [Elusimicrobiales bacterium]|nr:class I SAM-dependent methyltransferase [Elusimicrobiales bacterium]